MHMIPTYRTIVSPFAPLYRPVNRERRTCKIACIGVCVRRTLTPVYRVKALELALVIPQCLVAPEACFDGSKARRASSRPTEMI